MGGALLKATGVWLVLAVAAIVNGALRETVFAAIVGAGAALPMSGLSLASLVFVISWILIPRTGVEEPGGFVLIGIYWVVLTLAFEFGFGHFLAGKPWHDVLQVFNLARGDLFVVVICVTGISPYLVARMRGVF